MIVKFKKVHPDAKIPTRATPVSAGLDLYAAYECIVPARNRVLVQTGLCMELPPGTEGQVRPRSGLALKHGITVLNSPGTVDEDYRGELSVVLFNTTDTDYTVCVGDRIAQLVVASVAPYVTPVEYDDLSDTSRGSKGYGSSGK